MHTLKVLVCFQTGTQLFGISVPGKSLPREVPSGCTQTAIGWCHVVDEDIIDARKECHVCGHIPCFVRWGLIQHIQDSLR